MTKPQLPHHLILAFLIHLTLSNAVVSARLFPNVSSWLPDYAPLGGAWDAFRNFTGCHRGDNYDGLANLKSYFQRFGYIPHAPPSNFSDDFDDALESAIKTYQKNFNLNVTGVLDDATLRQIVLPRCGVADIINGTTTMNAGRENQTAVFAAAFARWAEVTSLRFRETASYFGADIRIGFFSGDHGDGEPFDGSLGTLAHAFSPTNGRFHLDAAEDWVVSGDVTRSALATAVDLESVAVHEIGHLLGLGHSSVEEAVMFPTISSRRKKVVLAEDDITGIQFLYGSNPNYNGSSATSSPERDSSDAARCLTRARSSFGLLTLLTFAFSFFALL
uniref:Metalloendoproteinase 1 n=1 Tax=Cajanus cajan TaxID=3821 RepID=A0A151R3R2_CAJCA|nr:Metalloendoproteinase 1 [Cajanus cajan]